MKIGGMNHPAKDPLAEIIWFGEHGFDYVDFTLEGPAADPDQIDTVSIRSALTEYNLDVVAHCAWYIPLSAPLPLIRQAALAEFRRSLTAARAIGASLMTTHYVRPPKFFGHQEAIAWHIEVLAPLCAEAAEMDITIAIENTPHSGSNQLRNLVAILNEVPLLRFHLDSGHAKLEINHNRFEKYLKKLGHKLVHVHLSDNDGQADQHLPLASVPRSRTDWPALIKRLKSSGYDSTISLEVFAADRRFLLLSRDMLQQWWDQA